jgi:hypothetical protein
MKGVNDMAQKKLPINISEMGTQIKNCSEEITQDITQLMWVIGSTLLYVQEIGMEEDFNRFMKENEQQLKSEFNL